MFDKIGKVIELVTNENKIIKGVVIDYIDSTLYIACDDGLLVRLKIKE